MKLNYYQKLCKNNNNNNNNNNKNSNYILMCLKLQSLIFPLNIDLYI